MCYSSGESTEWLGGNTGSCELEVRAARLKGCWLHATGCWMRIVRLRDYICQSRYDQVNTLNHKHLTSSWQLEASSFSKFCWCLSGLALVVAGKV